MGSSLHCYVLFLCYYAFLFLNFFYAFEFWYQVLFVGGIIPPPRAELKGMGLIRQWQVWVVCGRELSACCNSATSKMRWCVISPPPPPQTSDLPPKPSFPYTNFLNRIIHQLQSNAPIFFFKNVQNFIKINFF